MGKIEGIRGCRPGWTRPARLKTPKGKPPPRGGDNLKGEGLWGKALAFPGKGRYVRDRGLCRV